MPSLLIRITDADHAILESRAKAEGVSMAAVIRRAIREAPLVDAVKAMQAAFVGRGPEPRDLTPVGDDALAALVQLGQRPADARRRVRAVLESNPAAEVADIIRVATRKED